MCLAPFLNSFYTSVGTSRQIDKKISNQIMPCSVIDKGDHWDIQAENILESRNNSTWKDMRQSFLDGKLHKLCTTCINAEHLGASSTRLLNNDYLFEHLEIDIIHEVNKIIENDLRAEHVHALDWMPSNYCNYACIMCSGGASTTRLTFEIQQGNRSKTKINSVDPDFHDLIRHVKILGFTGGETIMQPEVLEFLDYLINNQIAPNMIITILTNVSAFPDKLIEKFKHFKRVLYTVSIDGTGDVIEYQRRGCNWKQVEQNALKIRDTVGVHEIINYVVTGVNILTAMDFVDWCCENDFKFIIVSSVFQEHLGVHAMPPELLAIAVQRLQQGRIRYAQNNNPLSDHPFTWLSTIDKLISVATNAQFSQRALDKFVEHIRQEDSVSSKSLHEIVPEWAPWFVN